MRYGNIPASLVRMWLTRSVKPFVFTSEYEEKLPCDRAENLGLYVHIPFCRKLCSFCPYCKVRYDRALCDRYTDTLIKEIHMAGGMVQGRRRVTSLYFGGGTPTLAAERIPAVISALEEHFEITEGIGTELHPYDVTVPVLEKLRAAGITKLSIGVQSFNDKYRRILGRSAADPAKIKAALSKVRFETVSVDLIFALPGQTFHDLRRDIDTALACGANHVAIYPFIDFTFTKSRIPVMNGHDKRKLLDRTTRYLLSKGCRRTSIWTFAKDGAAYSSMTRDNFLGFGCSATTLLPDRFKVNTFSPEGYCERIDRGMLPTSLTVHFTRRQRMVYWLFWKLYSTELDPADFRRFFGVPLDRMYGAEFFLAEKLGFLTKKNGKYRMTLRGVYYYHYFENFYTLSYIDKMWGLMRKTAFPDGMSIG